MNYNLLLTYLSELETGSWSQFRQALEYLADDEEDLYRSVTARQLSMLGHVEFAFIDDLRWSISPPTLAWLPRDDEITAVLCGQRTEKIVATLQEQAQNLGAYISITEQREGPDVVLITVPSSNVGDQIAVAIGAKSEPQAAERLAHCLPSLIDYEQLCQEKAEPIGYKIRKFNIDSLRWAEAENSTAEGLYYYDYYRPEHRLKLNGRCIDVPRNAGIFLLLNHYKRSVLTYDEPEQLLTLPVRPQFPILFARVATLCSGFLPIFDKPTSTHTYQQVTPTVFHYIATKLNQEQG